MDSIYNKYRLENDTMLADQQKTIEFFSILKRLSDVDYEGRVAIMKEIWGEQKDLPKTYLYGENCSITIFKENNQYRFTFDCKKRNFKDIQIAFPELAEKIDERTLEQLRLERPELFTNSDSNNEEALNVNIPYLYLYRNLNVFTNKLDKE